MQAISKSAEKFLAVREKAVTDLPVADLLVSADADAQPDGTPKPRDLTASHRPSRT